MRGACLQWWQPPLCWTQQSQKIFKQQEPLHLHKTLLYLYHDKLEVLKCSELEFVLTYSWMFTYTDTKTHILHTVFQIFILKKILRQAGHCFSDTVRSEALAAAPQTSYTEFPTTCITRTKTRSQRSWSDKHVLVALSPAEVCTSSGAIREQSPPGLAEPDAGGAACRMLHLALRNRKQENRRLLRRKKPATPKPFCRCNCLQPGYCISATIWIFTEVQLCDPSALLQSKQESIKETKRNRPGWSQPTQLPSSLLLFQESTLWQSVSFCEIIEINDKKCISVAYWEDGTVFSSY